MSVDNLRWEISKLQALSGIAEPKSKRLLSVAKKKKSISRENATKKLSELSHLAAKRSFYHDEVNLKRFLRDSKTLVIKNAKKKFNKKSKQQQEIEKNDFESIIQKLKDFQVDDLLEKCLQRFKLTHIRDTLTPLQAPRNIDYLSNPMTTGYVSSIINSKKVNEQATMMQNKKYGIVLPRGTILNPQESNSTEQHPDLSSHLENSSSTQPISHFTSTTISNAITTFSADPTFSSSSDVHVPPSSSTSTTDSAHSSQVSPFLHTSLSKKEIIALSKKSKLAAPLPAIRQRISFVDGKVEESEYAKRKKEQKEKRREELRKRKEEEKKKKSASKKVDEIDIGDDAEKAKVEGEKEVEDMEEAEEDDGFKDKKDEPKKDDFKDISETVNFEKRLFVEEPKKPKLPSTFEEATKLAKTPEELLQLLSMPFGKEEKERGGRAKRKDEEEKGLSVGTHKANNKQRKDKKTNGSTKRMKNESAHSRKGKGDVIFYKKGLKKRYFSENEMLHGGENREKKLEVKPRLENDSPSITNQSVVGNVHPSWAAKRKERENNSMKQSNAKGSKLLFTED
ncbi:uncharacterized protein MONOS_4415 [Monocercomonoides exilis]|uniref:uncharacterized protein n=1 Tax=Monocercomonoides exilis TaxID=2049356 RepID=UPI0035599FDD|nr:hypothetical protein MONOS_4415 [Monocercomonoides exilis]|eukprot:MONOS_4415.1-p1 / transcript=MONOS_4415.1 / gene=MONOS_4415 / organism=Monocercomonoides_exilis_PA203 / gene_product=unspecified product / transcript_product=unspecified product / location=Mono_scaffold00117:67085-68901(-) / protein_length=566 / sequence_SO=supercontig / SO=protein_coding / is_pseudo=false